MLQSRLDHYSQLILTGDPFLNWQGQFDPSPNFEPAIFNQLRSYDREKWKWTNPNRRTEKSGKIQKLAIHFKIGHSFYLVIRWSGPFLESLRESFYSWTVMNVSRLSSRLSWLRIYGIWVGESIEIDQMVVSCLRLQNIVVRPNKTALTCSK